MWGQSYPYVIERNDDIPLRINVKLEALIASRLKALRGMRARSSKNKWIQWLSRTKSPSTSVPEPNYGS